MASTDARPIPFKNAAYRITVPIYDADGDLVTGAAGLDSEVSLDGGTFADCTNEATEIATSSGMYFLDLTAAEMNADTVAGIIKTSTAGAKTTPFVLYPTSIGIQADLRAMGGLAQSSTDLKDFADTGYDPVTHKVEGVKLADTSTTNTDMRGTNSAALASVLGAAVGASISADIAAVKAETVLIVADTGTDGVVVPQAQADKVWGTAARILTANTNLNDPTAAVVADAVWDELVTGHDGVGKAGQQLWTDIDEILVDTANMQPKLGTPVASVSADIAAVKVDTAATLVDTAEIGAAGVGLSAVPKTGFILAAAGLDSVATTAPTGVAANFREMVVAVWRLIFKKATMTATERKTYADNGTDVLTTQAVSDDSTTETQGAAS